MASFADFQYCIYYEIIWDVFHTALTHSDLNLKNHSEIVLENLWPHYYIKNQPMYSQVRDSKSYNGLKPIEVWADTYWSVSIMLLALSIYFHIGKHFIRSTEFDENLSYEANTGGITKIALKFFLDFFGQRR